MKKAKQKLYTKLQEVSNSRVKPAFKQKSKVFHFAMTFSTRLNCSNIAKSMISINLPKFLHFPKEHEAKK